MFGVFFPKNKNEMFFLGNKILCCFLNKDRPQVSFLCACWLQKNRISAILKPTLMFCDFFYSSRSISETMSNVQSGNRVKKLG